MIIRQSTRSLFSAASVRKRSLVMAAALSEEGRLPEQKSFGSKATPMTMKKSKIFIGVNKRSLVTTAMACMLPRCTNVVIAIENSRGGRSFSSHTRTPKNPISRSASSPDEARNTPIPKVLRTLVRRLNEPIPLRATRAADASSKEELSTVIEERRRLAELADELVEGYHFLPPLRHFGIPSDSNDDNEYCERGDILEFLAQECCPSESTINAAVDNYKSNNYEKLRKATTPKYEGLINFVLQQNAVTGMSFLATLREDLLSSLRYQQQHEASEASTNSKVSSQQTAKARIQQFRDLDSHLKLIFKTWFAPGLLSHERITYDSTPAKIIEAIATKEAVHPMKSLNDLKDRLGDSKRVFALFHPCLPNQPLVFVHVALLPTKVPSSMDEIMELKKNHHEYPEVATFYSISNGVKGLAGVGLGEYLLKKSIRALQEELPCLKTFVTLSPIPNFRKWIRIVVLKEAQKSQQRLKKGQGRNSSEDEETVESLSLLSKSDREALQSCGLVPRASPFPWKDFLEKLEDIDFSKLIEGAKATTDKDIYQLLLRDDKDMQSVSDETPTKHALSQRQQFFVLRSVLLKLACRYLGTEKHRGKPLDKVCGFHVGNGAELHKVHFGADLSRGGLSNSYGVMANYLYDTEQLAKNQANFESSGFVIPVGEDVRKWLDEYEK